MPPFSSVSASEDAVLLLSEIVDPCTPPKCSVDVVMQSPSGIEHHDIDMSSRADLHSLQGASCTAGGFIHGQALENAINHADFEYNQSTAAPPNVKGMVHVYSLRNLSIAI